MKVEINLIVLYCIVLYCIVLYCIKVVSYYDLSVLSTPVMGFQTKFG